MTTQEQPTFDDAPEVTQDAVDEGVQPEAETEEAEGGPDDLPEGGDSDQVEFPKKAINALNRKNKQITKLRAQMRELETKLQQPVSAEQPEKVDLEKYETYDDYVQALIKQSTEQAKIEAKTATERSFLEQQRAQLQAQRNQYISEQAAEVSKTFTDLPQVWQQNANFLDSLPPEITDVFYSIDNAPAAVYVLAKEGRLESLLYANPFVAASEIISAQNKGLGMLSKPRSNPSPAPEPISKARGTGTFKKQLSPSDNVLKSLGLK